jgi:hypothetical protein
MKNTALTTLLLFFALGNCFSQTFKVQGKVVNSNNEIVPFANILLLNATDSTFIKGTSALENGMFELTDIEPDLYLLQASYIGKASKPLALDIMRNISIGALLIPSVAESLDEVIVTARRPTIRRLSDRLVFNVENTVVSQGSSWDILKNTPGVIVNQDDLQIRGQSATVYLNDRKVQLSGQEVQELLQRLTGTVIKSVEVIMNPPARYDAEGGPILNIVTSKSIVPGYKGSINGSYTQAVFPKYNFGTGHYYKTDKLNIFANYSISPKKEIRKTTKGINFINDENAIFSIWDSNNEEISRTLGHNGTLILDYDFNDKNTINFTSNVSFNPNQEIESELDAEIRNGQRQIDSTFTTDNILGRDNTNLAFDLSYTTKLSKEGAKLSFNGHFTNYEEESSQRIDSRYFNADQENIRDFGFSTAADQNIRIFTTQIDYATPIGDASFESGLKYSSIDSGNSIAFFNFSGTSDETVDASLSDDFNYNEKVFAGYLSYVKNWDKWSTKLGLRAELTDAEGVSSTLNQTNTQDFFEVFPSLNILYTASDKSSFAFDYGRKVDRPRYNDLNPFRLFINENDFEQGNQGLIPSFSNNFNLNYTLNNEFFVDVYYRDNGRIIGDYVFQDNSNLTLRQLKQNATGSKSFGLDLTYSKEILRPWNLYAYTSLFHEDNTFIAEESGNQEFTVAIDGIYVYLANYLTLTKDGTFTGEIGITYLSNFLFGSYISDEQLNFTLGLRKSLWDNRAVISLAAEDLLEAFVPTYTSQYLNQDNFYRRRPETQFIRFGFTYNFGNFKLRDNERSIDKNERDRLNEN